MTPDENIETLEDRADRNAASLARSLELLEASIARQLPAQQLQREIDENPYALVGAAACTGLLLGLLL